MCLQLTAKWMAYCSSSWSIDLDFYHFPFNNLCFFSVKKITKIHEEQFIPNNNFYQMQMLHSLDPNSNGFSKSLAECLSFAHLQGEDLTTSQRCEGSIRAKGLGNACIKKLHSYITWTNYTSMQDNNIISRGEWLNDIVFWKSSNVALTHSNGSLSCARLASNQHCPASNVTIFDHLQNDPCCPTGGQLAYHPLGHLMKNRNRYA